MAGLPLCHAAGSWHAFVLTHDSALTTQLVSLELYMGCLQEQAGAASSLVLARLLCALTRPEASVRVRVLSCCQALGAACKRAWGQDSEALLPAADCAALMKALAQQRVAIEGDSAAIEHLLDATLGADASAAGLGLPANRANSLRRFLLCTLAEPVGEPPSKAALHTLRFLAARVAVSASTPAEVADAAQRGLRGFAVLPTGEAAPLLSEEAAGAAADLVKLCDPGRLAGLLASDNAADAQPALEALWTLLRSAGVQGTGPARLVALQQLTTELYEALDEPWKERAVQVRGILLPPCWSALCCLLKAACSFAGPAHVLSRPGQFLPLCGRSQPARAAHSRVHTGPHARGCIVRGHGPISHPG